MQSEQMVRKEQIITAKGQKSQIILSDGTRVWLNAEDHTGLQNAGDYAKTLMMMYIQ